MKKLIFCCFFLFLTGCKSRDWFTVIDNHGNVYYNLHELGVDCGCRSFKTTQGRVITFHGTFTVFEQDGFLEEPQPILEVINVLE